MNYIISQLNRKINFLQSDNNRESLKVYYQSKFEFILMYILSYLWNKNWDTLDLNDREYVINCIMKPSIGTIVSIIRKLDTEKEFFGNKRLKIFSRFIDDYPSFRNEKIGHGYSFEDDLENHLKFYELFFEEIESTELNPIFNNIDFIHVKQLDGDNYKGVSYKPDGSTYLAWNCPKAVNQFELDAFYIHLSNTEYIRISPFIQIINESEFYTFCSVEEKLTGRTKFNQIMKTSTILKEIAEFERMSISSDLTKRKSANGTVINVFENNFDKYIDVGITKDILNFLNKNKSSVFATIWGHGGVGKTAAIQRVCDILCNQKSKLFDYVIFLSAKDRRYNFYKGQIEQINSKISTYNEIISQLNQIIYNDTKNNESTILEYQGRLLIIIDDFETFSKEENQKLISLIRMMDINHHKVILTTRAATLITGEEIQTKELDQDQTILFLKQSIKQEIPSFNHDLLNKELKNKSLKKKVFDVTSGRPLFILQLGIYIAQKGNLIDALKTEIKTAKEANNFLYDRLFEYLSIDARNMFLAIGLLINENDLTGLIDTLKFILDKEEKTEEFEKALNELIKLKIVVLFDKDFFKVYSPEIYRLMRKYYELKGADYDGNITNRYNLLINDKSLSTEKALLQNADNSRIVDHESEVENKYRYILKRDKAPINIKRTALLNFSFYLITNRNKVLKALKLHSDYFGTFKNDVKFINSYATISWSVSTTESKYQAIDILQNFFSKKPRIDEDTYLELLGLLTSYSSILVIGERDELKSKLRFNEINKNEYIQLKKNQSVRFTKIFKYPGGHLFKQIQDKDLMKYSPSCRNHTLDGLIQFTEICIRTNNKELAKKVCNKIIKELPQNFQKPFQYKLNKIEFYENPSKYNNDFSQLTLSGKSDLGIKLNEAFQKGK